MLVTFVVTRPASTPPTPVTRFAVALPTSHALAVSVNDRDLAISSDGTHLVYTAGAEPQLMIRAFDRLDAVPLAGITNARAPFLSPDGQWVGFFDRLDEGHGTSILRDGYLKRVLITGGPPVVICRVRGGSRGASWGPDDTIVFATSDPSSGLLRISARAGEPIVLTRPDPAKDEQDHFFPSVLPGGRGVLFTIVGARRPVER